MSGRERTPADPGVKAQLAMQRIYEVLPAALEDAPAALAVLADAERALKRAASRARSLPAFQRVELAQSRGPRLEFWGRLLADHEFTSRASEAAGQHVALELWETQGGDWVAAQFTLSSVGRHDVTSACIIERQDDAQAMSFSVMDFFDWSLAARALAKKLRWDLRKDID